MVMPLLTHGTGRTGSTLLLELLRTSRRVVVEGGYPYETRLVAGVAGAVLEQAGAADAWTGYPGAELIPGGGLLPRSSPFVPRMPVIASDWKEPLARAWHASATRIGEACPAAGYYAEKSFPFVAAALEASSLAHRNIIRIRDPRDVWCSILEFDRRRGFYGFGRQPGEAEEGYLVRYLRRMKAYYEPRAYAASASLWLRYEDLVADPEGTQTRLADWLGIELSWPAARSASRAYQQHITSGSMTASIGRWKADIRPAHRERIDEELGEFMARWGYL